MRPEISIILPTYNGETYLEESIRSILNQSFQDFELIVVDDCSNDETPKILKEFQELDNRIRVIRNATNQRLPASLNIGHRAAKGTFLTWTSDDNVLKSNFLERLIAVLKTTNSDVVYADFEVINKHREHVRVYKIKSLDCLPLENVVGASFMYKAEVFERISFNEDLHGIEDYDFWIRAAQEFKFIASDEVLYKYRIHGESLTSQIHASPKESQLFERNLKAVLLGLKEFSPESKTLLFNFHRRMFWDWSLFFKNQKKFEKEYQNWLRACSIEDQNCSRRYLELLRELLLQTPEQSVILKLILRKPQVIGTRFSTWTTLSLLKTLVFGKHKN